MSKAIKLVGRLTVLYGIGFLMGLVIGVGVDLIFPGHQVRWQSDLERAYRDGALLVMVTVGFAWWKRATRNAPTG